MRKLLLIAAILIIAAAALRHEREKYLSVEASSAPTGETTTPTNTSGSNASGPDETSAPDPTPGARPTGPRTATPGELPLDWQPESGESMAQVVDAQIVSDKLLRSDDGNALMMGDDFERVLAALSQEADAHMKQVASDSRARLEATFRTDPRFTVDTFACSKRVCLATVNGHGVPKPEDFQTLLMASGARPESYAALTQWGEELNANHDYAYRLVFAIDPQIKGFVVQGTPPAAAPPQAGSDSNTR